jgi:hypothetical protein
MEAFGIGQDEHMSEEKNFKILQNTPTGIVIEAKGDRLILGPSWENAVTNSALTISAQPGELRLLSAEGAQRAGYNDFELGLEWGFSANATNIPLNKDVTPQFVVAAKNGWDYVDIRFQPSVDKTAFSFPKIPSCYYVHKVYDYADLNAAVPGFSYGDSQHATLIWT